MPPEILPLLVQWMPWVLLVVGTICLPLSTVLYSHYLRFMKWLWSSHGAFGKLGGAMFGSDWLRQIQVGLTRVEEAPARYKRGSVIVSLMMIAVGGFWLWQRK
jgi:hypothetical protein